MPSFNLAAVIVAALSTFIIGGLWYSPLLFQRQWMKANHLDASDRRPSTRLRTFGLTFVFALAMALNLAGFLSSPTTNVLWGAIAGGLSAVWVTLALATTAIFERRSVAYVAINGGYWLVAFVVMGAILGAWH